MIVKINNMLIQVEAHYLEPPKTGEWVNKAQLKKIIKEEFIIEDGN